MSTPSCRRVRISLNIKGIPYKTVWVEYPDIEALCKKIGATAVEKKPDGSPLYTLPVIYDPNTTSVVVDSTAIARYLDKTYPDTPTLIPPEADALIAAFQDAFWSLWPGTGLASIIIPPVWGILREKSQPYFRQTREQRLGGKLEELAPPGSEKRAEYWGKIQETLHKVTTQWLEADGKDRLFFMGEKVGITYADIFVAGFLLWFKGAYGNDSQEWKDILTWDGGRWARFLAAFEKYEAADEGEDVEL